MSETSISFQHLYPYFRKKKWPSLLTLQKIKRAARKAKKRERIESKRQQKLEESKLLQKELCPEIRTRCEKNGPGDETLIQSVTSDKFKDIEEILSNQDQVCSQEALNRSLVLAAKSGHKLALILLLKHKANPNWTEEDGSTPLMVCAQQGFLEMVRILIDQGANVNAKNNSGDTSLILSMRTSGAADMARLLCTSANVNARNAEGYTALMKAVETGDLDTLKVLILNGADTTDTRNGKTIVEMAEQNGLLPFLNVFSESRASKLPILIAAVKSRDFSIIETFLSLDKNCIKLRCPKGNSVLEFLLDLVISEQKGLSSVDKGIIKLLIVNGVDVNVKETKKNVREKKQISPLVKAVHIGDLDVIRWLCLRNAKINESVRYEELTPLMTAAKEGFPDIIRFLLSKQANIETSGKQGTALDIAVYYKHPECAKILLEEKARKGLIEACKLAIGYKDIGLIEHLNEHFSLDLKDARLIEWSIQGGCLDIVDFLLSKGIDVNTKITKQYHYVSPHSSDFVCPLHLCVVNQNIDLLKLLMQSGAAINGVDSNGETPLFHACANKSSEIVRYLLAQGAEINARNNAGITPLFIAVEKQQIKHVNTLLELGADVNIRDNNQETPMSKAIRSHNIDIVSVLTDWGADTDAITKDEDSAITLYLKQPDLEYYLDMTKAEAMFKYLLQQSVDVNKQDAHGDTALILDCKRTHTPPIAVELFLQHGADVTIVNNKNESALSVAITNGHLEITKTLLEHRATFHYASHCQEAVHIFISKNHAELLPYAFGQGVYPFALKPPYSNRHLYYNSYKYGRNDLTPLSVALLEQQFSTATYLIQTRFLTKFDVTEVLNKPFFQNWILQRQQGGILNDLLSLTTLSFVHISDALGATPDREMKVNQLPLPAKIKEQLLFRNLKVKFEMS